MPQRKKGKERSSPEPQTQPPSAEHDPNMPSSSSSSTLAASYFYPPGFKFSPTDEELILYYLKPFSRGSMSSWPVHRANIYESNPQQLSAEYEKGNLKEWFFISERTNVNKGGKYQKRGDNGGYWHATGAAKQFSAGQGVLGSKASLVYYTGRQPNGVKTNWLMKEYCLESSSDDNKTVGHALCKIYQSPMAKNKKKEEGRVEALEDKVVEQPRNVESHQPPQPPSYLSPEMYALLNSLPIPDDVFGYLPDPYALDDSFFDGIADPYPLDGDRESDNSSYLKKSSEKD